MKTLQLITGLLLVLIAGVFWGTWFSLSRTMHELSAEMFLAIGKQIMQNVALTMSIIMPASILCLLILLIRTWKIKTVYFYCIFAVLMLSVIALIITVGVEVPIDNKIRTWAVDTIPSGWKNIREKWEVYHTIRTFVSLPAVAVFMIALMNRKHVAWNKI